MAALVKIVAKDFNQELLHQELVAAGLVGSGLSWSGFERVSRRIYSPSTVHGHTAGELRFKYEPELDAAQETMLDALLAAHNSTGLSTGQANKDQDEIDRQQFIQTFQEWDTLTNAQQLNRCKHLFRVCARLIDSTTDL